MAQTVKEREQYNLEWARKNPEKRQAQNTRYRAKYRDQINKRQNDRRKELIKLNPDFQKRANAYGLARAQKILNTWIGFIPQEANCKICDKHIFFAFQDKRKAIHFDHRRENAKHILSPTNWLKRNPRTFENELIWVNFDFGILCEECNLILPTDNRVKFLEKALAYAKT